MPGEPGANDGADGANGSIWGTIMRVVVIYVSMQVFMGKNKPATGEQPSAEVVPEGGVVSGGGQKGPIQPSYKPPVEPAVRLANAFGPNQLMDLRVYVTESEQFSAFGDSSALVWEERSLGYSREDSASSTRELNITITPSKAVQRNETRLWAHVYLSKAGVSPDPSSRAYQALATASSHTPLIKIVQRKIKKATYNLLSGELGPEAAAEAEKALAKADAKAASSSGALVQAESGGAMVEAGTDEPAPTIEWIPHFKPALTLNVVEDTSVYPSAAAIPPQVRGALDIDFASGRYYPVLYVNEFWIMEDRYVAVNETVSELPLALSFSVTTLMRWMLTEQMQQSLEQQSSMHGSDTMAEMRRMFAETSPWLLAVTAIVSCLHTVFDMLAFKNDISFWKNNKSMKGLSFRAMVINIFFQTVIFLYLMDNDTSWMILMSSGFGLAIEFWKGSKAIKSFGFRPPAPGSRLPSFYIEPTDSYTMSPTKMYDEEAMRYLNHALYPVIVGYSAYSLVYDSHKSFYSWLLGSTVNFVYSFGFILMTPQLFINYKLKSTAHMPWKTLMYKSLNTFIDDLFAFIIKMPTMHRLACLRDDLIFFIYLYQRWAYGIDKKRANEYGQVGVDLDEDGNPKEPAKELTDEGEQQQLVEDNKKEQ